MLRHEVNGLPIVVNIHGRHDSLTQDAFRDIGHYVAELGQQSSLRRGEFTEDIILCLSGSAAHAHPDARYVIRLQTVYDRLNSPVSAGTASLPNSNLSEGEIDLIVDEQGAFRGNPVVGSKSLYCVSGIVHEGLGLGEQNRYSADGAPSCICSLLARVKSNSSSLRHSV